MVAKVDFFIAGVQKGATSALDTYLRNHPDIEMAKVKETHFFDDDTLDWENPNYHDLHINFEWQDNRRLRGEATPIYLYWPNALSRLREYNSKTKLIILLRHPVYRAFSHWRMEKSRAKESLSFQDAVAPSGRQRVATSLKGVHRRFSYVERSLYSEQVKRLLSNFDRNQILFLRSDQLWTEMDATLKKVESFLQIKHQLSEVCERKKISPVSYDELEFPAQTKTYLEELFYEDIVASANLTGLDLNDWLRSDYRDPLNSV